MCEKMLGFLLQEKLLFCYYTVVHDKIRDRHCNLQMGEQQQRVFSNLQARNSEGLLNAQEVKKLNELMQVYRHGSVRKAKAMQVAVMRGLIPALNAVS